MLSPAPHCQVNSQLLSVDFPRVPLNDKESIPLLAQETSELLWKMQTKHL